MRISKLKLTNFRSFGSETETITLNELTALVGSNGSGKTAVLIALMRLFGPNASAREIKAEDFHVTLMGGETQPEPADEKTLSIEVTIDFPELEDETANTDAVADCFKSMLIEGPGSPPICKLRLTATWKTSSTPEGEIEQRTYWVRPPAAAGGEERTTEMLGVDRSRIQVHYIPAMRDPVRQIRQVSGSIIARLFKAAKWSDSLKEAISVASTDIQTSFTAEGGAASIHDSLTTKWKKLNDSIAHSNVKLQPVSNRIEDILRQVEAVFSPAPGGTHAPIDQLSDGQRSLFYLAMVAAAFDIEDKVLSGTEVAEHFDLDLLNPPSLTIFAVEEPENHIAPHFLGRIMDILRTLAKSPRSQVVLTTHSPSIMHRVEPEEVRHVRLHATTRRSAVNAIALPDSAHEAFKYIREAVRAYPELYFAKLVLLGEGDSEEIVLPRIAEAFDHPIDHSFVSVVPLGGRHVSHFWKLLTSLDVPFITLLDLDHERVGGGWGRIKYVIKQLLAIGTPREPLLETTGESGETSLLTDNDIEQMHTWGIPDTPEYRGWLPFLERYGVFFSAPLDLDFLMLQAFQQAYHSSALGQGPNMPASTAPATDAAYKQVMATVLKEGGNDDSTYSIEQLRAFFWYRYLFLGRGKPTTHHVALASISREQLKSDCPQVLKRLTDYLGTKLSPSIEAPDVAPA